MITVQQAALNALSDWLTSQLSTAGVVVEPRWPAPSKALPAKAVTIIQAGPRRDDYVQPQQLSLTNVGPSQVDVRYQIAAGELPVQLDVWAKTDPERDDILARLDVALHAGDVPAGVVDTPSFTTLVKLSGDWSDTFAEFRFDSVDTTDAPDAVERAEYRTTIRGTCYLMIAVTKRTARQILIKYNQQLSESDPTKAPVETYTLTPP